jgi:hypothetical protein
MVPRRVVTGTFDVRADPNASPFAHWSIAFLDPFDVLPFDRVAADTYARVRFDLERIGRPIGERDLLIASVALTRDLTVVTHNLGGAHPSRRTEDRRLVLGPARSCIPFVFWSRWNSSSVIPTM